MKNLFRLLISLGITCSLIVILSPCVPAADESQPLKISGAGLLSDVVAKDVKLFAERFPKHKAVIFGATTGKGFGYFATGEADIVMATREILASETEKALQNRITPASTLRGKIEVAIITRQDNPVDALTIEQLRKVFAGEVTNWRDVGGRDEEIVVTTRAVPETGMGVFFQEHVLKGAPYAQGHLVMPLYQHTVTICGGRREGATAIGYIPACSHYYTTQSEKGIKVIAVKLDDKSEPLLPSSHVVVGTSYPIAIPFYYYWNAKSTDPSVQDFVKLVQSAEKTKMASPVSKGSTER